MAGIGVKITGLAEVLRRLTAIKNTGPILEQIAVRAVREQKLLVPRKTGNLGRSIHVGRVTAKSADTIASAHYATFVELGTKPHEIVPRRKKALRFPVGGGSARLSGSPRSGGNVRFAKRVNHPGTKAQPFMVPGAEKAVRETGAEVIVDLWNRAA